jgi:hypothetical protein
METLSYQGEMRSCWRTRPCNCDADVGTNDRCPQCHQYHLRPGYCQALDPINAGKYPELHRPKAVDTPNTVDTPVDNPSVDTPLSTPVDTEPDLFSAEERRRRYQAEWVRRKREAGK